MGTIADKFLYIPYDNTQNYPFCRFLSVVKSLETHLNKNLSKFKKSPMHVVTERERGQWVVQWFIALVPKVL